MVLEWSSFTTHRMLFRFNRYMAIGNGSTNGTTATIVRWKFAQPASRGDKLLHQSTLIWVHIETAVRWNLEELRRGTGTGQRVRLRQDELTTAVSQRGGSTIVAICTVYLIACRFQFVFQVGHRRRVHWTGRERKSGIVRVGRRETIIVGIVQPVALA